jgi:hypothetical protein
MGPVGEMLIGISFSIMISRPSKSNLSRNAFNITIFRLSKSDLNWATFSLIFTGLMEEIIIGIDFALISTGLVEGISLIPICSARRRNRSSSRRGKRCGAVKKIRARNVLHNPERQM